MIYLSVNCLHVMGGHWNCPFRTLWYGHFCRQPSSYSSLSMFWLASMLILFIECPQGILLFQLTNVSYSICSFFIVHCHYIKPSAVIVPSSFRHVFSPSCLICFFKRHISRFWNMSLKEVLLGHFPSLISIVVVWSWAQNFWSVSYCSESTLVLSY